MKSVRKKLQSIKNVIVPILLIIVLSALGFSGWYIWRATRGAFEYQIQTLVVIEGREVSPEDFLAPGRNTENISAVFRNPLFRPAAGHQDVHLTLTMGMRIVEATASLYVLTVITQYEHEFADIAPALEPMNFIANASVVDDVDFDIRFAEEPMLPGSYPVGEHILPILLNNVPFEVTLTVKDTTPPAAESVDVVIRIGTEVSPGDFVANVTDASDHRPS